MLRTLVTDRRWYRTGLFLLATLGCAALIAVRYALTGRYAFFFLLWNLALAWVPYGIALFVDATERRGRLRAGVYGAALAGWLLFLPNAPYILTDLVHLGARPDIPLWYDLVLLLLSGWTGLLLGFASLRMVERSLCRRFGVGTARAGVVAALVLSGFGVYLGRFLRWNSWDVITNFGGLMRDIAAIVLNPFAHVQPVAATALFSGFLLLAYALFNAFREEA